MMKKTAIDFNHISTDLSESDIQTLKDYYFYYHRLEYVYRHTYKFYKNLNLGLTVTSGLLTSTSIVTLLSPINPLAALVGAGVLVITGVTEGLALRQKSAKAQFIYQHFQNILNDIKSYLRGINFDKDDLAKRLNTIDNVVTDIGLPYIRRFDKKYRRKYME